MRTHLSARPAGFAWLAVAGLPAPRATHERAAAQRFAAAPLLFLTLLLTGCSDKPADANAAAAPAATVTLTISGSTTQQPMVAAIARRFEASQPGTRIEVAAGGSGKGLSDLREGKSDIAMVSRVLDESEKDLHGFAMGRDGIAVLVHRDNRVSGLKQRQLRDIFTGKTTRWSAVGGSDVPIHVITRDKGRGSLDVMSRYLGIEAAAIIASQSVGANAAVYEAIQSNPQAVAFLSLGESEARAASAPIKLLAIDGVAASSKTISSGNYPIARPLLLVTREQPAARTKAFIDFALSPQVADIVKQYAFVPYLE